MAEAIGVVRVTERLPPPTLDALCSDDESLPPTWIGDIVETEDLPTTGLVDLHSFEVASLTDVVDGVRPIVVWTWRPCMADRNEWVARVDGFAQEHRDNFQVVAVGLGGGFLRSLEMADIMVESEMRVLWSPDGVPFMGQRGFQVGSLQLFSVSLENRSLFVRLNDTGRDTIVSALAEDIDGTWTG